MRILTRHMDRKTLAAAGFASTAAALAVYIAASSLLPVWVEGRLNSMLSELAGTSDVHCEVLRFDAFGAELGQLRVGPKESPALLFESCNLRYSPLSLLRRHIAKLTLSGLDLNCEMKGGLVSLPGMKLSQGKAGPVKNAEPLPFAALRQLGALPVSLDLIEVKNAQLSIDGDKFTMLCPFELTLSPDDISWSGAQALLQLQPNGQRIAIEAKASRKDMKMALRAATPKEIRLESIPITAFMPLGSDIEGRLSFEAQLAFEGPEARLSTFALDAAFKALALSCTPLAIDPGPLPLKLKIRHAKDGGTIEASNILMAAEYPFEADRIAVKYELKGKGLSAETEIDVKSHGYGSIINAPSSFHVSASATPSEAGAWKIAGSAKAAGPEAKLDASWYGVSITSLKPSADFEILAGGGQPLQFNCSAKVPALKLASPAFEASSSEVSAMARRDAQGRVSVDTVVSNAQASSGSVSASSPGAAVNAELKDGVCAGVIRLDGASAKESRSGAALEDLALKLPFRLPFINAACDPGELSVKSVKHQGRPLGRLDARIFQAGKGFCMDGAFDSDAVPGLKLLFKSSNRLLPSGLESSSSVAVPAFRIDAPFDLGKLLPQAKGSSVSGEFSLDGDFRIDAKGRRGKLVARASGAAIKSKAFSIEGVDAAIELPHLPLPISSPAQELAFKGLKAGALDLKDGKLSFRLDGADSVFVERFAAGWCGGKLRVQSFSFKLGEGSYDLILHCDRVAMGRLLEQFGVEQAAGEGSLNGTIPVKIDKTGISFQDGFLYSTPGIPAGLNIPQTEFLTAGVPEDNPAYGNLFIAKESLKSFTYSWAKVKLDTRNEVLHIQLVVDGKPGSPIPVDSKPDGSYVVNPKGPGTVFQGITLEVNFNVPLSKVLGMGKGLKGLMDKLGN